MRQYLKCLIGLLILSSFISVPAFAGENKPIGTVQQQISNEEMPQGISFITQAELKLLNGDITIPEKATVYAVIVASQGERRWHKSGFILCRLKGYTLAGEDSSGNYIDLDQDEIYMVARKYEKIDKKEAGITTVEVTATTTASFIVPGVDIAYYFTKGMIHKKENQTRFKSGVTTAYENSIFWFWLKGKPIDLEPDASIKFKEISKNDAKKLEQKMEKVNKNIEKRKEKPLLKNI